LTGTVEIRARRSSPSGIPFLDFGGSGPALNFLHANGYPPACYAPLLARLTTEYHVFGMLLRPLWPNSDPRAIRDWSPFSKDLRNFLREQEAGAVIGMGHSIGAIVTLRAALRYPQRFSALVLLDPVLLPRRRILQLAVARVLRQPHRVSERILKALARRRTFDDLEQLFAGYRKREIFRYISDENLRALIQGLVQERRGGGFELAYSPTWEARIYETAIWNDWDLWTGLRRMKTPTLIIRGAETDTFWESTAERVKKMNPTIQLVTVAASTHLVPLERPEEVFLATRKFLREQSLSADGRK
jgi:pimeloyl-ACP methyl ester carboxylesterase